METNLLDRMLNDYQSAGASVVITLQNKIRVAGVIKAFDSYVIVLDGQKREIVYRHAMSSLAAGSADVQKTVTAPPVRSRNAPPRPAKTPQKEKNRQPQPKPSVSGSNGDTSINTGMKEGLLKWMQEQKAAK